VIRRGFPLPFGRRHSLLDHPVPAEEFRPPHGRPTGHKQNMTGPRRGYRVPHARATTAGSGERTLTRLGFLRPRRFGACGR
jgi:hypothetical protein